MRHIAINKPNGCLVFFCVLEELGYGGLAKVAIAILEPPKPAPGDARLEV